MAAARKWGRNRYPGGLRGRIGILARRESSHAARIVAREVVSLESSGALGYVCGVKSDNCKILV